MISKSTIDFLELLQSNNDREWFAANKKEFQEEEKKVKLFFNEIYLELQKIDSLESMQIFRIYRDVRFSKNKSPYKTNFGAALGMGKGSKTTGYYLHLEPGKSFIAGGVYQPEPSVLKEIRKEIEMNADEFLEIVNAKEFIKNFGELSQTDKLVKVPQGFDKDSKMGDFLKLKNIVVMHSIKDENLLHENAISNFVKIYKTMKPLNDFLDI